MFIDHELCGKPELGDRLSGVLPFLRPMLPRPSMKRGDRPDLRLEALRKAGRLSVTMSTGCMAPLVKPGDVCEVRCAACPLGEGDLFVFKRHDAYILHRFRGRGPGGAWLHQGDLDIPAETAHSHDILVGRVASITRGRLVIYTARLWFRLLSRVSVRLVRLESRLFRCCSGPGMKSTRIGLSLVHRLWSTALWSLFWAMAAGLESESRR